ncbi:hypothetical protein BCR44DRAFT_1436028 [Catenaria anguillulae PL171]|uniref:Uncharacterized protein n=1 Tax=Catenaria anguillulae PL171 TaxID=765915 RepID=A0A1Y2HJ48_9FUNG|nr:hypothetical protein BCR44DRAFT_1436028 [Catenaria anguillulae PL171]
MEPSASSTSLAGSSSSLSASSAANAKQSSRQRSRSPGAGGGGGNEKQQPPSRSGTLAQRTPKICTKCGLQLSGQFVRALGGTYHLNCFKCIDCGQIVAAKFFPITDDTTGRSHPLCERDYFARLDLLCAKCGGALRGSYISALGRKYHVEHFTCSQCPPLLPFHFSTQYAAICTGCRVAILKQFQWHPECYMIHKSWNVSLAPNRGAIMSRPGSPSAPSALIPSSSHLRDLPPPGAAPSAQQASRVWSVLSVFEESAAACISDMLLHVSNGHYVEGVHEAALFILHVEVLFAGIDGVDERLARFGDPDQVRLVVPKEPKLLCKKVVGFFSLLSQAGALTESHQQVGDLLSLVTSLAHLLKVLIRQALVGALKLERTHGESGALSEEEYRLRAVLETDVKSDLCHVCRSTIEEACVALGPIRWHSLVDERHSAKYVPSADPSASPPGRVLCEACFTALDDDDNHPIGDTSSSLAAKARSGFTTVTSLSQYTFLLRVALKQGLNDALADSRRKRVLSGTILDATTAAAQAQQQPLPPSLPATPAGLAINVAPGAAAVNGGGMPMPTTPITASGLIKPRSDSLPRNASAGSVSAGSSSGPHVSIPRVAEDPASVLSTATVDPTTSTATITLEGAPSPSSTGSTPTAFQPLHPALQQHNQHQQYQPPAHISQQQQAQPPQHFGHPIHSVPPTGTPILPPVPSSSSTPVNPSTHAHVQAHAQAMAAAGASTTPAPQPADMWLSELGALELFLVRHLAVRELEPLLTSRNLMRSDEASGSAGGGIWGKKKSPSFGTGGGGEFQLVNAPVAASAVVVAGGAGGPGQGGDRGPGEASPAPNTGGGGGSANGAGSGVQGNGWATFGVPLDVLVHRSGLRAGDLHVEGVFRKNGNIKRLNTVKEALDASPIMALELLREDHPVQNAALLKKLYRLFTASTLIQEESVRRKVLHYGLCLLPKANRDVLEVLLLCLRDVANACQHPSDPDRGSKMDYSNLATVIAPNLLIPGKGVEEEHGAIVSCMFDLLMWQESMWTVPRTIAGIIRQSTDTSLGGSGAGSFGGLGGVGATANPKELLRRVELVARSARDAPREHRLSNASMHGPARPINALIEDAAGTGVMPGAQSMSTSPTLQSIPPS